MVRRDPTPKLARYTSAGCLVRGLGVANLSEDESAQEAIASSAVTFFRRYAHPTILY